MRVHVRAKRLIQTAVRSIRGRTLSSNASGSGRKREYLNDGKTLRDFVVPGSDNAPEMPERSPSFPFSFGAESPSGARYYIETMGCQMNVSDSEIVRSILNDAGMAEASDITEAHVILVNTCSVRDNAERKVWDRLTFFDSVRRKRRLFHAARARGRGAEGVEGGVATNPDDTPDTTVVGVLGCMAERLKTSLLESERGVDLVVGPDAYRDLPNLLTRVGSTGQKAANVILSVDETYADIAPVRPAEGGAGSSAFVSIMRGCNNMCSYCIVPFTRGRERSRDAASIVDEVRRLTDQGCREVTLLGQNVNSYNYIPGSAERAPSRDAKSEGFVNIARPLVSPESVDFTELVSRVAAVDPELRVRFTSPHPKDFPDDLIAVIAENHNVCSYVHLPAQSGSSAVLERMRRGYTREAYLALVDRMRAAIPELTLSTDIIAGFCGETDDDHALTVDLMRRVRYDLAFMFKYSTREKTHAHRRFEDDVPEHVKSERLKEIITTFYSEAEMKNQAEMGQVHLLLVEGKSKKSAAELAGRSCSNKRIVFPIAELGSLDNATAAPRTPQPGDYVAVKVNATSAQALRGEAIGFDTMQNFYSPTGLARVGKGFETVTGGAATVSATATAT